MPSGQVQDLIQSPDGRIWIATPSGLATYDGCRIRTFSPRDGLRSHGLRALGVDSAGRVWVGSDAGFDVLQNLQVLANYPGSSDWSYGFVECIHCDGDQTWLGTAQGLLVHDGNNIRHVTSESLNNTLVIAICSGVDGAVWVADAHGGLFVGSEDKWAPPANSQWQQSGRITCLAQGNAHRMFVGGANGFVEISSAGFVRAQQQRDCGNGPVRTMLLVNKELWVAQGDSLSTYKHDDGIWHLVRTVIEGYIFKSLIADSFGNIWSATESDGVAKISILGKAIKSIKMDRKLAIFAIRQSRGTSLIATGDRASWYVDANDRRVARRISALDGCQTWDVLELADGILLAATATGLRKIDVDGGVTVIGSDDAILSRPNRCLVMHGGRIFVGTLGGCVVLDSEFNIEHVATVDSEALGYVYTLFSDQSGSLWAGTLGNGLWVMQGDRFARFEHPALSTSGNTYAMDQNSDGVLALVQDDHVFTLSAEIELSLVATTEEPIAGWTVHWGTKNSLWTGSASGLSEFNVANGERLRNVTALFGIDAWEFTTSRSLYVDADGGFYCGVNSGLIYVDTRLLSTFAESPEVKLDAVDWQRIEPQVAGGEWVVPHRPWTVEVSIYCAWYLDESDLKYRFRLTGFDDDWRELSELPVLRLNTLPPGRYELEAQAFNRLVGFGPQTRLLTLRVTTSGFMMRFLMWPIIAIGKLRRLTRSVSRNTVLNERNLRLQETVKMRTAALEEAKQNLESANQELSKLATTDALTGVSNRRHFDELIQEEVANVSQTGRPLSLLLMDIDEFKRFNDHYGHARGDDCLSFVARKLEATLYRVDDRFARYGGEEFVTLLPDCTPTQAMVIAERLREAVEALQIRHVASKTSSVVTVSIGASTLEIDSAEIAGQRSVKKLIEAADSALYQSKGRGRNCASFQALDEES